MMFFDTWARFTTTMLVLMLAVGLFLRGLSTLTPKGEVEKAAVKWVEEWAVTVFLFLTGALLVGCVGMVWTFG